MGSWTQDYQKTLLLVQGQLCTKISHCDFCNLGVRGDFMYRHFGPWAPRPSAPWPKTTKRHYLRSRGICVPSLVLKASVVLELQVYKKASNEEEGEGEGEEGEGEGN